MSSSANESNSETKATPAFAVSDLRIFVGNLPECLTKAELLAVLGEPVPRIQVFKRVQYDRVAKERRRVCFAFVTFTSEEAKTAGEDALRKAYDGVMLAPAAPRPAKTVTTKPSASSSSNLPTAASLSQASTESGSRPVGAKMEGLQTPGPPVPQATSTPSPGPVTTKVAKGASSSPSPSSSSYLTNSASSNVTKRGSSTGVRRTRLEPVHDSIYIDVPNETETADLTELFDGFAPDVKVTLVRKPSREVRSKSGTQKELPAKTFAIIYVGEDLRDKALTVFEGAELRGATLHPKLATSRVRIDREEPIKSANPAETAPATPATAADDAA